MFCSLCGTKLHDGASFCSQCGAKAESKGGGEGVLKPFTEDTNLKSGMELAGTMLPIGTPVMPVAVTAQVFPIVNAPVSLSKADTVKSIGPALVLVDKGNKHQLRFKFASDLKAGREVPALFGAVHEGMGLGRKYTEERKYGEWRYTETALGAGGAVSLKLERGKFLKISDANLVLDVSFWKMAVGTPVNMVGGSNDGRTYLEGGAAGRSWTVNVDGTISPQNYPNLVLGVGVPITTEELEGCWGCGCFPCGSAFFSIKSIDRDEYEECGIFFWFFGIPFPYNKKRKRTGPKSFVNKADKGDTTVFQNKDKNFFPPNVVGCGGRIS